MPYRDKKKQRETRHKYYLEHQEEINAYKKNHRKEILARQREYQKIYRQRRAEFMVNKSCPYCGTTEDLVLHHILPKDPLLEKSNSNYNIWAWKESRRIKELLKCIVVCNSCHRKIHAK